MITIGNIKLYYSNTYKFTNNHVKLLYDISRFPFLDSISNQYTYLFLSNSGKFRYSVFNFIYDI